MKILGADWSAFCKALPECYYFDDTDSPDDFADTDIIGPRSWGYLLRKLII